MKKIFLSLLVILSIFGFTGCGSSNKEVSNNSSNKKSNEVYVTIGSDKYELNDKTELNELHYLNNYVDFNTDRVGNTRTMSFNYDGKFSFEVRVNYQDEHSIDEVKELLDEYEEKTKEVNGIKYFYYEYKNDLGDIVHYYLYEYNNKPYSIIFFLGENPGNIEEVFMNNVSFK